MKQKTLPIFTSLILAVSTFLTVAYGNPLEKQILKLQPQADKNGDGKLSKVEEAALHRIILKRFPRADADGDGVLSIKEQQAVIWQTNNRDKIQGRKTPNAKPGNTDTIGKKSPTHANVKIRRTRP